MKVSINTLLRICSYISLAICFLPVVDYYCPWYITVLPALVIIALSLYINRGILSLLTALMYITGLAILLLWVTRRNDALGSYIVNFYITFLPVIIAIQLSKVVKGTTFFKDYLSVMLIFVAITCITTMIGHQAYPMASRELASGTAIYDTTKYLKTNIGGYEFIYALVLLIPMSLWLRSREKGFRRFLFTLIPVLMVLCVYSSQYTIALVCTVVVFLVMLLQKTKKGGAVACGLLVVFLVFNGISLLADVFKWASQNVGMEYVADRLLQVSQFLSGQRVDTDTSDARVMHYTEQLEAFWNSPIFGHNWLTYNKGAVSGHTLLLDMLGAGGIIGTGLMVFLFRGLFRISVPTHNKKTCKTVRAVWIMATMIAVLNPVIFPMIATVVFTCCMCIERVEKGEVSCQERRR